MERLSLHLWSYLNCFIGHYEHINIRRRGIYYHELLQNFLISFRTSKLMTLIFSGSRGEGFNFKESDYDFMTISNNYIVLPVDSTQTQTSDILMETDDLKPGFARLRLYSRKFLSLHPDCVTEWNGGLYISSLLFRDLWVSIFSKHQRGITYGHGPCFTYATRIDGTELDCLQCFQCNVWPHLASEWVHRYRPNYWPSRELINEIIEDGCLLVPIGNPSSPVSFMEWRLSFSLAERKLVYSLNHTQFLCYGLLKLFLKHAINSNATTKDLLCSYFMKTILFYVIEEEPLIWDKQNLFICFWTCFKRLLVCVREGSCQNYFLKHNNMFEHKITGVNKDILLQHLSNLYDEHFEVLARIPIFAPLFRMLHFNSEWLSSPVPERSYKESEYEFFLEVLMSSYVDPISVHEVNMIQYVIQSDLIRRTTNIYDTEILIRLLYESNYDLTQYLYHVYRNKYRSLPNKSCYRYLTMLKNHITHNCTGGDICTGWLQYATLCYLTGQYRRVIRVMDYVLSKFKPYTLNVGFFKVSNRDCFIETICGNSLSISKKRRIAVALSTPIIIECEFYPSEIKPEILVHAILSELLMTPNAYLHILKLLSCHKLGYGELGEQALDTLYRVLSDEEFNVIYEPIYFDLVVKCRSLLN